MQKGATLLELVATLAVVATLAAVAIPSAARVDRVVSGAEAARRLALVLRTAQAEAQSRSQRVAVSIADDGDYVVSVDGQHLLGGRLGAEVESTYPSGMLEFDARGRARLPGSSSPRAGRFEIPGAAGLHAVIVQLSGCVRCR